MSRGAAPMGNQRKMSACLCLGYAEIALEHVGRIFLKREYSGSKAYAKHGHDPEQTALTEWSSRQENLNSSSSAAAAPDAQASARCSRSSARHQKVKYHETDQTDQQQHRAKRHGNHHCWIIGNPVGQTRRNREYGKHAHTGYSHLRPMAKAISLPYQTIWLWLCSAVMPAISQPQPKIMKPSKGQLCAAGHCRPPRPEPLVQT